MKKINHVKAYIIGLLVGGGKLDSDVFVIDLPFKKWGMDPSRMSIIATDILTKICHYFNTTYNFNVSYEISSDKWLIKPMAGANIEELKKDLAYLSLPTSGFLLERADLTGAKALLKGISIESFLSGIFDARASLTLSHRRFTDDAPVVSVEIPGSTKNFSFVVQLCTWLTDLGSTTDQILYNHPNQHSTSDPYYKSWKKGFKIRFLVLSFLARHSFALQSKSLDITKIKKRQKRVEQIPCYLRKLSSPGPVTIHSDQNSKDLPLEVRNKIFFHYHHFCAVLGCPYAPVKEIKNIIAKRKSLISFYPKLAKGPKDFLLNQLESIRRSDFPHLIILRSKFKVENILNNDHLSGYPGINQGIAYLFAGSLKGKRHQGRMKVILDDCVKDEVEIVSIGDGFESPLVFINNTNNRAFICSSIKSKLNQDLIQRKIEIKNELIVSIKP